MAYVNVDIDLDEFDTDELCNELSSRINKFGRKGLSEEQKKRLWKELEDFAKELKEDIQGDSPLTVSTLNDALIIELFSEAKERYSLSELQQRLA